MSKMFQSTAAERDAICKKIPLTKIPIALAEALDVELCGFTEAQIHSAVFHCITAKIFTDPVLRQHIHAVRCEINGRSLEHGPIPETPPQAVDPTALVVLSRAKNETILLLPLTDAPHRNNGQLIGTFAVALQTTTLTRAETLAIASRLLSLTSQLACHITRWREARRQIRTLFHDLRNALTTSQAEMEILKRSADTSSRAEREQYLSSNLKTAAHLLNRLESAITEPNHTLAIQPQTHRYRATELVCRAAAWTQAFAETIAQELASQLIIRTFAPQDLAFRLNLEPAKLDSIIQNVVKNGVEAACANRTHLPPAIEILIQQGPCGVSLIVRDSGVGFCQTYLDAQENGRLGSVCLSTKDISDHYRPRGFGLFSVRQTLDSIGGQLNCARRFSKSCDAEMTEVEIYLPCQIELAKLAAPD